MSQSDSSLREYNVLESTKIIQYNHNIPLNTTNRRLLEEKKSQRNIQKLGWVLQRLVELFLDLSAEGISERRLYAQK